MADIYVYGTIGDDFWDEGSIGAAEFSKALDEAGGEDVVIHINSVGGSTFDASAMSERVRAYKGRVTASIEGVAASAASYFALTADEVVMNKSALIMVHNPSTYCVGQSVDLRKAADMLDKVRDTIVACYADKTGMGEGEICALMDDETWMGAVEAKEMGFVDRLTDEEPVKAMAPKEVLDTFKHAPGLLYAAAGDTGRSIRRDNGEGSPTAGAAGGVAGAVTRSACVNGSFLKIKER